MRRNLSSAQQLEYYSPNLLYKTAMAVSIYSKLSIIERLPFELQLGIFDLLDYQDAIRLAQVNHYFHNTIFPQDWPVADKEAFVFRLQFEDKYHRVWGL